MEEEGNEGTNTGVDDGGSLTTFGKILISVFVTLLLAAVAIVAYVINGLSKLGTMDGRKFRSWHFLGVKPTLDKSDCLHWTRSFNLTLEKADSTNWEKCAQDEYSSIATFLTGCFDCDIQPTSSP